MDDNRTCVWYIYLHLVNLDGKCRCIYYTWMLWGIINIPVYTESACWMVSLHHKPGASRVSFSPRILGQQKLWCESPNLVRRNPEAFRMQHWNHWFPLNLAVDGNLYLSASSNKMVICCQAPASHRFASWWLSQPISKIWSSIWIIFSKKG